MQAVLFKLSLKKKIVLIDLVSKPLIMPRLVIFS